jgi:hypothetical protein
LFLISVISASVSFVSHCSTAAISGASHSFASSDLLLFLARQYHVWAIQPRLFSA